jgi:hypothetical protein
MKRRYQIDQQRAVQEFRQLAREQNPNLQMIFPMTEVVGLLQEGVGHLMREAGLALMSLVMEEEVRHLAGDRHEQHPARRAHRWGKEAGYCVVDGQKVPIERTRLRTPENHEQRLGSYEMFQRSGPMEHAVWDKLMRGLSTRIFMLCQGQAKLSTTSRDGKTFILRIAKPGEVLGLHSVVTDKPYDATVETMQPCQLNFVNREDFLRFLKDHSDACLQAAQQISRQCLDAYEVVR